MIDIRTEVREAFEREQSPFPPPAALRAQIVAEVASHARASAPARQRTGRDLTWLMGAAAVLLAIAIVAGLLAVRSLFGQPTPVKSGPPPQLCVPGATSPSDRFARIHGCLTYSDGTQIVAADPHHLANRIVIGPSNGLVPIAWSRDGRRLLLSSTLGDLFVMNTDGSQTRLTHGDASGWEGSLSPDGTQVVYDRFVSNTANGVDASTRGLYVVDVSGSPPRLLAASTSVCTALSCVGSSLAYPEWSPDGSRIAYADYRDDLGRDEIWIMNSDGTNQRRIVTLAACPGATQGTGCTDSVAWSPDGSQVAFHSAGGIYTARANGSGLHLISSTGGQPVWSPDGSLIAFTRGGELFTMAAGGSDVTLVEGVVPVPNYGWTWNPLVSQ
jgi:Tol biopolymer transport system component